MVQKNYLHKLQLILYCCITFYFCKYNKFLFAFAQSAEGSIVLKQGAVVGLKIFPETSQTPVFSYLGIPYAQPPVGALRFAPPQKHLGWNKTIAARDYKPICPQMENYVFDEVHNGYPRHSKTDENCLYLNIWTPQSALRNGNYSVLVIITGEEQAFDWIQNRPSGLDLASEGVVVVTIQSRTNVFGWLTLRNANAPGNLGLLDQYMAMEWIQDNIVKFGGNPKQVTLLGHGTSGGTNAMLHLTSTKEPKLFSKLIVMSGTIYSPYSYQSSGIDNSNTRLIKNEDASRIIIKKLACESSNAKFTLDCLRQKSVNDLLKAFENVYQHGNYTVLLGPQEDEYLPIALQYLGADPKLSIEHGRYPNIPIMIGICSNEGAFMQELWIELAREGYESLRKHLLKTILPNVLTHYGFSTNAIDQIKDAINWRFFDQIPHTPIHLLNGMQRLLSETKFESPFLQTIEKFVQDEPLNVKDITTNDNGNKSVLLDKRKPITTTIAPDAVKAKRRKLNTLYVYTFHVSNTMDIRGSINYFGGASHTSDLLYLMGPSLFQQIGRRKLSPSEMKLCKKIRAYFTDFTKNGNPTPGRLFDAWRPYTPKQKYIQVIGESIAENSDGSSAAILSNSGIHATNFEQNIVEIESLLNQNNGQTQIVSNSVNPYRIGGIEETPNTGDNNRMSKSYLGGYETSQYYNSLIKINSFWNHLLPKIYRDQFSSNYNKHNNTNVYRTSNDYDDQLYIAAVAGNGSKFKHAFFSMLILVCLLLAVLCVCVYILKKNRQNIDTSFL